MVRLQRSTHPALVGFCVCNTPRLTSGVFLLQVQPKDRNINNLSNFLGRDRLVFSESFGAHLVHIHWRSVIVDSLKYWHAIVKFKFFTAFKACFCVHGGPPLLSLNTRNFNIQPLILNDGADRLACWFFSNTFSILQFARQASAVVDDPDATGIGIALVCDEGPA